MVTERGQAVVIFSWYGKSGRSPSTPTKEFPKSTGQKLSHRDILLLTETTTKTNTGYETPVEKVEETVDDFGYDIEKKVEENA